MRSPIKWFGGKGNLVNRLLPLIPQHETYIEVFGGGASLLFAKDPSPLEVYNDLDSGLVTFFRVLRDPEKFARFYHLVMLTPYSREEWGDCRDTWAGVEDEAERAYRWFVVARMSFSGVFAQSWGFSLQRAGHAVSAWLSILAEIPAIHERFSLVQVENRDFRFILETYDSPQTFFYLDPPYVPETRQDGEYAHELTLDDHEDLVRRLLTLKGKAMLSGYAHDVYEPLVHAGWRKADFPTVCHVAGRTRATGLMGKGKVLEQQARVETVWMNYDPMQEMPLLSGAGSEAS